jgi:hypothetical protein
MLCVAKKMKTAFSSLFLVALKEQAKTEKTEFSSGCLLYIPKNEESFLMIHSVLVMEGIREVSVV